MNAESNRPIALLVSDEERLASKLREALEELGFETFIAIDAIHAKEIIEQRSPSFVCTDLILPRGSGHDVCQLVRANRATRGVPILVMDDRGMPEEVAFAEEAGASALITKPFSMVEFLEKVQTALENPPPRSIKELRQASAQPASEAAR